MSLIGKGTSSLRKKDVMEQKSTALGFKKVRFAHKATAGDTGIDLTSLVQPTEMATYGFVNPNVSELSRAQINLFRNNLKLVSSIKGLLVDQLSYVVASATQINFIDFTAEDGEIFTGWLDEAPTTSLSVVDGQNIVASGILAAGDTDFNIGMPIPINQNSAQQIGAVMVFADRGLQYRKVGNVDSGDGDYIEVPVAGGLGSLIRFDASGVDRFITVVSNGVVAERPDGSMTAMIERAQGQIDQMVPVLAAVSGLPETTFQTGPNSVDLKQFGDTVLDQQNQIETLETTIATLQDRINSPMRAHFARTAGFTVVGDTEAAVDVGSNVRASGFGITKSNNADFTFVRSAVVQFIVVARWRQDVWTKVYLKDLTDNTIVGESVSAGASSVSGNQPGAFVFHADVVPGRTYRMFIAASGSNLSVDTPTPTATFTNFTGVNYSMTVSILEV